jgi:predicted transcriptional regulator
MQTKLTLRLDDELIREVKAIAGRRGQPISRIVANYFNSLKKKPK